MSLPNRKSFFKILIIVCFALVSIQAAARKLSIESVSLSASQHIPAHSLQTGGTVLYISGSGFNAKGKGITVYFGPCECNVIRQESTSNMIVCKIAPMVNSKLRQNLPVTVYMVNSLPTSCNSNKCLFSYVSSLTSELLSQEVRILAEGAPVLKITCTEVDQYDNGGAVCASCVGVDNSQEIATTSRKACVCNPTFIWNSTQESCICPKNFILVNGQCKSCAPLKNKYGTGLSVSQEQCQCKSTFTFNVDSFVCACTEPNTFINSSGLCFSCGDITTNGTGLVNSTNSKACECLSTYSWNAKVNDCTCLTGSILNNQQCFACSTLKGKNSTGAALTNVTCHCNPTFVFSIETKTCVCPESQSYIDKTSGGCVPCLNVSNSTATANVTFRTCNCLPSYIWNPSKNRKACLCPDNSFILTNGTCFPCTSFKGKNGTGLPSKGINATSCQCLPGFIFNIDTNVCECPDPISYIDKATGRCVPCSNISNGSGLADVVNRRCLCLDSTYVWTPTLRIPACVCANNSILFDNNNTKSCFSCTSLKTKNGTGLTNGTSACGCLPTFTYISETRLCQCLDPNSFIDKARRCVSCTGVQNSPQTANKTTGRCNCNPTYIWNPTLNSTACVCPNNSIILSDSSCFQCVKGKNGTGKVNNTQCQCLKSFVWKSETNTCECPEPNSYIDKATGLCVACGAFGNSTGQLNKLTNLCVCTAGFVFTPSVSKSGCVCPASSYFVPNSTCVVCSGLRNKNGTGAVNKSNGQSCECLKSFVFNTETFTCNCPDAQSYIDTKSKLCVSCENLKNGTANSTKADKLGKKCYCADPSLIWTPTLPIPDCICPPNSIFIEGVCISCSTDKKSRNLTGLIGNSTACACVRSFIWNSESNACQCPSKNSFIDKSSGSCVACDNITNGNSTADVAAGKCNCLDSTYLWLPKAKPPTCSCPPNSIIFNSSCFLCTTLKGKNGTGAANANGTCACLKSFTWNENTRGCQCPQTNSFVDKSTGACVTCNLVENSTNIVNQTTNSSCACDDTFVWDIKRSTKACLCPTTSIFLATAEPPTCFSCATLSLPNATGRVNSTNKNICECGRSYVFNTETNVCECPNDGSSFISTTKLCVSCSNVANSPATVNQSKTGCTCNEGYTYNTALNKCLCVLPKKEVSGTCTLPTPKNIGSCPNNMSWDAVSQSCICQNGYAKQNSNCVDCSSINNSNGLTGTDRTSCQCKDEFNWNPNTFSCN